jgi:hypothetical protein
VTRRHDDGVLTEAEGCLAGLDDEDLGVRVPVDLRADAGLRVDEDHRERHAAVLGADELVAVRGRVELIERDHERVRSRVHGLRHVSRPRRRR